MNDVNHVNLLSEISPYARTHTHLKGRTTDQRFIVHIVHTILIDKLPEKSKNRQEEARMVKQLSTSPHLITTEPSYGVCSRCSLRMVAATVAGFDYRIDPTALNPTGELAALLSGRATFELHGQFLVKRGPRHTGKPVEPGMPVLAEHVCGAGRVPEHFVDPDAMVRAVALCVCLLGATPFLPDQPPF